MKAMLLKNFSKELKLREVDRPIPKENEVLLELGACGVCHTDLKILSGEVPTVNLPHIPGHEISGRAVKTGSKVDDIRKGDRFAVAYDITCGYCYFCRIGKTNLCTNVKRKGFELDGGYAQYIAIPRKNIFKIPEAVSFEEAAILPDAVATPYTAIKHVKLQPFHSIAIIGVGGLGIHAVQIARLFGAEVIAVDISEERLQLAEKFGADILLNSKKEELVENFRQRIDFIFDFVGVMETLQSAIECLSEDGTLVILGYEYGQEFALSPSKMVYKGIHVIGGRGSTPGDFMELIKLIGKDKIKPVVTKKYHFTEANKALKDLKEGKILGRTVLTY